MEFLSRPAAKQWARREAGPIAYRLADHLFDSLCAMISGAVNVTPQGRN
jgi:hypothetical protein